MFVTANGLKRLQFAAALFTLSSLGATQPTEVRMMAGAAYGIPPKEATSLTVQVRRAVFDEFHRRNPDIRVVNAGGLNLAGDNADNVFLMSMAGDTAPDIFYVNFRQYYTFLDQGFCRPLDDLIAKDPQVNQRINPTVRKVLTSYDGKIYAMPFFQVALALYYRKDFFVQAGLDPNEPPKTWAQFYDYSKKLSQTAPGRFGFELSAGGPSYHWQNFLYQAGGEVVVPTQSGVWKATIATEPGVKALEFYRHLMVDKWKDPTSGKTVGPAAGEGKDLLDDIRTGKTAMWFGYTNDVVMQNNSEIPPSVIGIAALPAGPAGHRNEINAGMWAINSRIKDPKKLEACWRFIKFFSGDEAARMNTSKCVELGIGNLVNPTWLKKFGYEDLLGQVDPSYVKASEEVFQTGHPEPYGRNCQQVYSVLDYALQRRVNEPTSVSTMSILKDVQDEMNQKLLGYIPEQQMQQYRTNALIIAILFGLTLGGFVFKKVISREKEAAISDPLPAGISKARIYRFVGFCIMPAALTIAVWAYYPLFRGLIIAFQDYKVLGNAKWVGFDNFIGVFTQPVFYKSLLNSFIYVALSLLIGFFLPIFLALALNEIPRFKVFFRTVFYLPAMTSSIVVSLLWRQFYDKTDQGLLNSLLGPILEHIVNPILSFLHMAPVPLNNDWLGNPSLAMYAVVLPGIWAGAGPGSILYLAALKNIQAERYEAADIDGANWRQKILHITLPGLKPLILINLLGVFIAGFKAMENVFVLTGGGPVNATRTIGLEIWQNAFMYLKFGYATAAAWVMGSILVGFTLIQIRSLLKMRFSTAKV